MTSQPKYQISKKGLSVWRIHAAIESIVLFIIVFTLCTFNFFFNWSNWIYVMGIAIWFVFVFLGVFLFPKIRWNHWRYEVRDQEIEIQKGLFIVERTLVPMVRVQHVDTSQGPILKHYNLSSMSISTAATTHTIPALPVEEADQLRVHISELARVAEDDV
ncbi:PH domain-containing protein [Rummeliibacillus pycnus]|uniref:PH domain-containing protein n=1 Tax=Rummeliibacillus pycnus TaxID=101070 RepID=UPI000C9B8FE6|nr:PH domain-containing protein [Rummeliibacillus pycnus]